MVVTGAIVVDTAVVGAIIIEVAVVGAFVNATGIPVMTYTVRLVQAANLRLRRTRERDFLMAFTSGR